MVENIRYPRVMNPLWIISLFITMTEAFAGYAVLQTTSDIQLILTIFVVSFPIIVSIGFFIVLWNRHQNLYAPRDYQSDSAFLESVSDKPRLMQEDEEQKLSKAIKGALTSQELRTKIESAKGKEDLTKLLSATAENVFTVVKDATSIKVDLSDFKLDEITLPYHLLNDFSGLTDEVYYALNGKVKPYTYGTSWILIQSENGKPIKNARMIAGIPAGRIVPDNRSLEEVGIKPGDKLKAVKPPQR